MPSRTPKRPVSPAVMRRRRLVAAGLAVALIIAIALFIASRVAGDGPGEGERVTLPDDIAEQTEGDGSTPAACDPADLTVKAHTDALTYPAGQDPKLSLSVENTGKADCVADLGTATMVFTVANQDGTVWKSSDCQTGGDERLVILESKKPLASDSIAWNRTHSSPDTCDHAERTAAETGEIAYQLSVEVAGVASTEPALFLLQD